MNTSQELWTYLFLTHLKVWEDRPHFFVAVVMFKICFLDPLLSFLVFLTNLFRVSGHVCTHIFSFS